MKSSANPSHRQHHHQQRVSVVNQQQPGRPSLVAGELLQAVSTEAASDPSTLLERSTLLETKKTIDHLKSVTGMIIRKLLRYYAIWRSPSLQHKKTAAAQQLPCVFFLSLSFGSIHIQIENSAPCVYNAAIYHVGYISKGRPL